MSNIVKLAIALVATASVMLPGVATGKPAHKPQSVHRPMQSAPVYLDGHSTRGLKWGDPGFYEGWTPPPARGGGVG